tara:strand:+ start:786 stop:1490 length:705 start_codon:yes stop_codon:yes gene_type:complete
MVSIDNVYKTVLNILNKENRGYIVPREFNTLALQAQSEIFEGYFSSRNYAITNDSDYSDIKKNIEEKIAEFENEETIAAGSFTNPAGNTTASYYTYPTNFYRLSSIGANNISIQEVTNKKLNYINRSPLMKPTTNNPLYVRHEGGVVIHPTSGISSILINYVRKPADPQWVGGTIAGQVVANTSADTYKDFELHSSEFPELVIKILSYAGVIIRAADIAQVASAKEQQIIQSER